MAKWDLNKAQKQEAPRYLAGVDKVNNPPHYGTGKIECIDYIEDFLTPEEYIGYLRGNIAKYLHRWRYKNGIEDLNKAQWYLNRLTVTNGIDQRHLDLFSKSELPVNNSE
tara:strand:+ start:2870 stop:3199 length:330 start_codon:yes stop_codon:yes gene_type:complete